MKKILQIGEGNFLRAFAENFIQNAKKDGEDISVAVCQPRKNTKIIDLLKAQEGSYHIYLKGRKDGKIVDETVKVDCVSDCIDSVGEFEKLKQLFISEDLKIVISNTTEAGICFNSEDHFENYPDISFPAKITYLLSLRFSKGADGLIFLPVELIEDNADCLKQCILDYAKMWNYSDAFISYVNEKCCFCNTLVDRIVTGHIEGDSDVCSVACEPYASWIIEADKKLSDEIPFAEYSSEIQFCKDLKPYRQRKVKILNGTHTMTIPAAYMCGFDIVRDVMNDDVFAKYINLGLDEIKSTISMPIDELDVFADSVKERFNNPFIDHKLYDISLNSISKFNTRCLPSVLDYIEINHKIPKILAFSFAALIAFYTHKGSDRMYVINDSETVLNFFETISDDAVWEVLSNINFWGQDLTKISGLADIVSDYYEKICINGIQNAVEEAVK